MFPFSKIILRLLERPYVRRAWYVAGRFSLPIPNPLSTLCSWFLWISCNLFIFTTTWLYFSEHFLNSGALEEVIPFNIQLAVILLYIIMPPLLATALMISSFYRVRLIVAGGVMFLIRKPWVVSLIPILVILLWNFRFYWQGLTHATNVVLGHFYAFIAENFYVLSNFIEFFDKQTAILPVTQSGDGALVVSYMDPVEHKEEKKAVTLGGTSRRATRGGQGTYSQSFGFGVSGEQERKRPYLEQQPVGPQGVSNNAGQSSLSASSTSSSIPASSPSSAQESQSQPSGPCSEEDSIGLSKQYKELRKINKQLNAARIDLEETLLQQAKDKNSAVLSAQVKAKTKSYDLLLQEKFRKEEKIQVSLRFEQEIYIDRGELEPGVKTFVPKDNPPPAGTEFVVLEDNTLALKNLQTGEITPGVALGAKVGPKLTVTPPPVPPVEFPEGSLFSPDRELPASPPSTQSRIQSEASLRLAEVIPGGGLESPSTIGPLVSEESIESLNKQGASAYSVSDHWGKLSLNIPSGNPSEAEQERPGLRAFLERRNWVLYRDYSEQEFAKYVYLARNNTFLPDCPWSLNDLLSLHPQYPNISLRAYWNWDLKKWEAPSFND